MLKRKIKIKIRNSVKLEKMIMKSLKFIDSIYQYAYKSYLDQKFVDMCKNNLEIRHGIFKGMKYPSMEATGSALGIKLLGVYEEELVPILKRILNCDYKKIIDVGAAEGYYAIGLARLIPDVEVKAFDIDPYARKLLSKMARENEVVDKVKIGSWFTKEVLLQEDYSQKTLIISDCEGYEKELFDNETNKKLRNVDILMEVHDNLEGENGRPIYNQIYEAFKETHNIEVIYSMSTAEKACKCEVEELSIFTSDDKEKFLAEREWKMVWLFMVAK